MKIIFLDIDGVLNSQASAMLQAIDEGHGSVLMQPHFIHVATLWAVLRVADASIVVSSVWRYGKTVRQLNCSIFDFLSPDYVIGVTPRLNASRGTEIKAWLKGHPEVDGFVILDDEADMDDLLPWLVKTDTQEGLLPTHVPKILATLNRPWRGNE